MNQKARGSDSTFTVPDQPDASTANDAASNRKDSLRADAASSRQDNATTDTSAATTATAKDGTGKSDTATKKSDAKDKEEKPLASDVIEVTLSAPAVIATPVSTDATQAALAASGAAAAAAATIPPTGQSQTPNVAKTPSIALGVSKTAANPVTALALHGPASASGEAATTSGSSTETSTGALKAKTTSDAAALKPATGTTTTATAATDDKAKATPTPDALVKAFDATPHASPAVTSVAPTADLAVQTLAAQAQSQQTPPAAPPIALPPTQTLPATPIQIVPLEIGLQALRNGSSTFDIRLDPAELGKVQVKLKISGEGNVSASLVADRVETLQMLQRESKTLERAFEQAGLKSNPDGLQFSLRRDDGQQGGNAGNQQDQARQSRSNAAETPDLPANTAVQAIIQNRYSATGLDIQI